MRLVVVDAGFNTGNIFKDMFDSVVKDYQIGHQIRKGDVLLFEGGTDVNPDLYGDQHGKFTQEPDVLRDFQEAALAKKAISLGIPMIGICRGAQLLCVMSGGKLVQHVTGHGQDHFITDYNGDKYWITSSHHQMLYPYTTEHEMIARSTELRSTTYMNGDNKQVEMDEEPEIVWFPKTACLSIQGHPEWMASESAAVKHCREYVKHFILGE